jgi:hypothetical protein
MNGAFPFAAVEQFSVGEDLAAVPDPDDRHVVAAAKASGADLLVTMNLRDFPDGPHMGDVEAVDADDALVAAIHAGPDLAVRATEALLAALRRPAMTLEDFLERLTRRAPIGAVLLGASCHVPLYERLLEDILDAEGTDAPQRVVLLLIEALEDEDERSVVDCLTSRLADRLRGDGHAADIVGSLRRQLRDVLYRPGWGFGTAKRVKSPNVEYVKLVQGGPTASIALTPRVAAGHLFEVVRVDDRWLVDDVDGPDPAWTATGGPGPGP